MSSNTQARVSPPPPPPPKLVKGQNVLDLAPLLGERGCELLRETLEAYLSEPNRPGFNQLLDWQRVPEQSHIYQARLGESEIRLRLQGMVAEVMYEATVTAEQQKQLQNQVYLKVNELVAVTLANRIKQRLTQGVRIKQRQRVVQRVQERLVNRNIVRINAQVSAS